MFIISVMVFMPGIRGGAQTFELEGQLSGWMTINPNQSFKTQVGLRYIPVLSIEKSISEKYSIDTEISLNTYGAGLIHTFDNIDTDGKVKPYRMWLRFSSSQFEVRLGLQKINFGSATFLRPLMWFDSIDPRDPLQLTDGVYGLLGRYYFLNNTNIWLWGLYGNDRIKGWEYVPSDKKRMEYGGRMQAPFSKGEIAFSYHHRQIDTSLNNIIPEERFGLDGKWDIGIGLWFEGALIHQDVGISALPYRRLINVGLDYTFKLGNGLNVMGEYFIFEASKKTFGTGEGISFSVVSLSYPLGLFDNITVMVYYDWANNEWYRFVNWQRTFDKWSFYLMGFWNPEQFQIYQNQRGNNLFTGMGFQLMAVFNH